MKNKIRQDLFTLLEEANTHTGLRTRAVTRVEMFPAKTLGEPSLALDGSSVFLLFGAALASLVLVTHLWSSEIRPGQSG